MFQKAFRGSKMNSIKANLASSHLSWPDLQSQASQHSQGSTPSIRHSERILRSLQVRPTAGGLIVAHSSVTQLAEVSGCS